MFPGKNVWPKWWHCQLYGQVNQSRGNNVCHCHNILQIFPWPLELKMCESRDDRSCWGRSSSAFQANSLTCHPIPAQRFHPLVWIQAQTFRGWSSRKHKWPSATPLLLFHKWALEGPAKYFVWVPYICKVSSMFTEVNEWKPSGHSMFSMSCGHSECNQKACRCLDFPPWRWNGRTV
jgi:hypothetical protein